MHPCYARGSSIDPDGCRLLAGYGFTLADNPFNTAVLQWDHALNATALHLDGGERSVRRRLRSLHATGLWEAYLGRGFVFDRRGAWPAELRMCLRLLAVSDPLPMWAVGSACEPSAEAERAAIVQETLRGAWAMPTQASKRIRLIVSQAIQMQQAEYDCPTLMRLGAGGASPTVQVERQKRRHAHAFASSEGHGTDGESANTPSSARRLHAARLVEGELCIWEAALAGGRPLQGLEAEAAEAGSRARRQRLDAPVGCDA